MLCNLGLLLWRSLSRSIVLFVLDLDYVLLCIVILEVIPSRFGFQSFYVKLSFDINYVLLFFSHMVLQLHDALLSAGLSFTIQLLLKYLNKVRLPLLSFGKRKVVGSTSKLMQTVLLFIQILPLHVHFLIYKVWKEKKNTI